MLRTFLGWNSYLTQCWKPLPLTFIDVNTKQFPTKWAVYPTPLDVLKLMYFLLLLYVLYQTNERNANKANTKQKWWSKRHIFATSKWEKNQVVKKKCNAISNKLSYRDNANNNIGREKNTRWVGIEVLKCENYIVFRFLFLSDWNVDFIEGERFHVRANDSNRAQFRFALVRQLFRRFFPFTSCIRYYYETAATLLHRCTFTTQRTLQEAIQNPSRLIW